MQRKTKTIHRLYLLELSQGCFQYEFRPSTSSTGQKCLLICHPNYSGIYDPPDRAAQVDYQRWKQIESWARMLAFAKFDPDGIYYHAVVTLSKSSQNHFASHSKTPEFLCRQGFGVLEQQSTDGRFPHLHIVLAGRDEESGLDRLAYNLMKRCRRAGAKPKTITIRQIDPSLKHMSYVLAYLFKEQPAGDGEYIRGRDIALHLPWSRAIQYKI